MEEDAPEWAAKVFSEFLILREEKKVVGGVKKMENFEVKVYDEISERNGLSYERMFTAKENERRRPNFSNGQKSEEKGDGIVSKVAENAKLMQESENLVFFDKDEGAWKCRVCSWKNGSVSIDYTLDQYNNGSQPSDNKLLDFELAFGGDHKGKKLNGNDQSKRYGIHSFCGPSLDIDGCTSSFESSKDGLFRVSEKSEHRILAPTTQKSEPVDACLLSEIEQEALCDETALVSAASARTSVDVYEKTEGRKGAKIEVIKSIVYGGLAESIISLSLVLAAAGGDAATINIVVLGLANLIGGVFVIFHNLLELRTDGGIDQHSGQVATRENGEDDRYTELLGQRENFTFHSVVSILSYLISGSIPILIYGFFFRVSNAKELKLLTVAIASLWCITALAIGKAYVCTPKKSYLKTVLNYIALGFMSSATAYAIGGLLKQFLYELGLFQEGAINDPILPSYSISFTKLW